MRESVRGGHVALPLLLLLLFTSIHVGCSSNSPPPRAPLEVGVATRDITPPVGYRMAGYFYERRATAVHDVLYAKAIAFKQGPTKFVLIVCDLCQTAPEVVEQARSVISQRLAMPREHVCIASTHTHTGPDYFGPLAEHLHRLAIAANAGEDPAVTIDYPNLLAERIIEAAMDADASAKPAELAAASAPQPNVAFNRRYVMRDGTVAWNPGKKNPKIVRPAGPIDPNVQALVIGPRGTPRVVLTNFPLHPDTVGGTEFSGDFPCYLQESLRQRLNNPKLLDVFAQGTSGNINHVDVSTDDPQKGHEEAQRIGAALADAITPAIQSTRDSGLSTQNHSLAIATTRIDLPLQQFSPEEVANARALFAKIQDRKLPFLIGVRATKIVRIYDRHHGQPIPAEVQALRLDDDTAIVMLPSELFVEFGLEIKRRSPFRRTFVIELANQSIGYIPTKKAFEEGAYEPTNSIVQPGSGERLTEGAIGLLEQLKRRE
jgi:hypothetical protein